MNGPKHYQHAERTLEKVKDSTSYEDALVLSAVAQAHATLAQTAAILTARPDATVGMDWLDVLF